MGDSILMQPRWLKLSQAATYSAMSRSRLRELIVAGEVRGYQDQHDRRGPKGEGVWTVDRLSLDAYHERQMGRDAVAAAVARVAGL